MIFQPPRRDEKINKIKIIQKGCGARKKIRIKIMKNEISHKNYPFEFFLLILKLT